MTRNANVLLGTVLGATSLFLLSACSGGGGANKGPSTPVSGKDVVQVSLQAFEPGELRIAVGDTVTWANQTGVRHTVTSGESIGIDPQTGLRSDQHPDGMFDAPLTGQGATFRFRFTKAGTYHYYCSIHQSMNATVVVA